MFLLQPRFLLPVAAIFGFIGLAFYVVSDGSSALDSALVLTGVSTVPDLLIAPPEQRPTYVIDDLAGLFDDPESVRVGPQPGWNVEVFDSRVVVTPDDDAAAVSMVPAVVHAIWAAIDGTDVDVDTLSVAAGDAATQERLAVLGIPS